MPHRENTMTFSLSVKSSAFEDQVSVTETCKMVMYQLTGENNVTKRLLVIQSSF